MSGEIQATQPAQIDTREYVEAAESMAEALPWRLALPADLTKDDFARLIVAFHTTTRKSALAVGHLYSEAVQRFGEEAYQLFKPLHYQESTLKNYRRLSEQIDPSLWPEPISDRQFLAIAGQVKDAREQREWVEYARGTEISADALREEIRENHEARGIRPRAEKATWVQCDKCNGEGGWPESRDQ